MHVHEVKKESSKCRIPTSNNHRSGTHDLRDSCIYSLSRPICWVLMLPADLKSRETSQRLPIELWSMNFSIGSGWPSDYSTRCVPCSWLWAFMWPDRKSTRLN